MLLSEQHEAQIAAAAVQLGKGKQAQRNRATRRGPARVEDHRVLPAGHPPRSIQIVVDAEVEMGRDGAEALAKQVRKPRTRSYVGKALAVALLRPGPLGRGGEEVRLVVLHQI